ncbi:MAG TPA: hypothetical protein VGN46_08905, partial [Luteibacter sp.]
TIYRSLFVQSRGVLKKQLLDHLRTKRMLRYPQAQGRHGKGRKVARNDSRRPHDQRLYSA